MGQRVDLPAGLELVAALPQERDHGVATASATEDRSSVFPEGVGQTPSACGAYSSGPGRFS